MKKVYLVEDNKDNADLILDMLSGIYEIKIFTNALELFNFLDQPDCIVPDAFLMDINLPGMNGGEILENIRIYNKYDKVPIIAVTAQRLGNDREHYLSEGFSGYISKPITDSDILIQEIESAIKAE